MPARSKKPDKTGKVRRRRQVDIIREPVVAERRVSVMELRKGGLPLRAIAKQLEVSHEQVRQDLKQAMNELLEEQREHAEGYREMINAQLDKVLLQWYPVMLGILPKKMKMDDRDLYSLRSKATEHVLKALGQRAKLYGYDAAPPEGAVVDDGGVRVHWKSPEGESCAVVVK